jgi:hypothetical protein
VPGEDDGSRTDAFVVAQRLEVSRSIFHSHHGELLGGEYGWAGNRTPSRRSCGRSSPRIAAQPLRNVDERLRCTR